MMTYEKAIQDVLDYIDNNLGEKLTIESLAAIAHFSPYHFCRVFQWYVGYSVMIYVRKRRLEFVVSEFSRERKMIDIAMDYGFETYSGFAKAFKRHYNGISPEDYRGLNHPDEKPKPLLLVHMKKYTGGIIMTPKIIEKEAFKVAGYSIETKNVDGDNNRDIPAFWQAYSTDGRADKLHDAPFITNHSQYGICYNHNPESGGFSYIIGLEVRSGAEVPEEFETLNVKPSTYAVFSTPPASDEDFVKNIQGTWVFIMEEWFPTSGYEYAPGSVDFEYYREEMHEKGNVCDIYIPVVKK